MNFQIPKSLKIKDIPVSLIIGSSTGIASIFSILSYLKLDNLDFKYKIIMVISIFLVVSIVDIIILYVRDREKQYVYSQLNFLIEIMNCNLENVGQEISQLRTEHNKLSKEFDELKQVRKSKV